MRSRSEEDYLKAIFKLLEKGARKISTNEISRYMNTTPASVTDMLKKLSDKKLIIYTPYKGVSLTVAGRQTAVIIIRKHRLWEYFLVHEIGFRWDEVHEIAEQLEHIRSEVLVEKLDHYLGNPRFDPHGDPIPDRKGNFQQDHSIPLSSTSLKDKVTIRGVIDHHPEFLQFLTKHNLVPGNKIIVREIFPYDRSMNISFNREKTVRHISNEVARNILVMVDKSNRPHTN